MWPVRAQYRDDQFEPLMTSGSTTFDAFEVTLSGQLRHNAPGDNLLRATRWSGPIGAIPLLSDSLITVTTPNPAMTSSGYSSAVLSGASFSPWVISTTPSTCFFRAWAEDAGQTDGDQTKWAETLGNPGHHDDANADPMVEVVPEIAAHAAGGVLALVIGAVGLLERRRLKPR